MTVVILGGMGMTDRHLRIFERLYARLGASDVRLVRLSFTELTLPPCAKRRIRCLQSELSERDGRYAYHVFSGALFFFLYFNRLADSSLRSRSRGVVFESTPIDNRASSFGRYLAWRLKRSYHPVFALPFVIYRRLIFALPSWEREVNENFNRLEAGLKVLFVYSESDPVADARAIEGYADRLRRKRLDIETLRLDNAGHCQAICYEYAAYKKALDTFLQSVSVAA